MALLFFVTYYIYVLFSESSDRFYVGYSTDPWSRLIQHLNNNKDKFTGKANDWELKAVFQVSENASEALKLERFIKKQKSRKLLQLLCDPHFVPQATLAQLVRVPHVRD